MFKIFLNSIKIFGEYIVFPAGRNRSIFIEDQTLPDTNGDILSIGGGRGKGSGSGSDIYIVGGEGEGGGSGDGGAVTVKGGDGSGGGGTSGRGADSNLIAGSAQSGDSDGGTAVVQGGDAAGAGNPGEVIIKTGKDSSGLISGFISFLNRATNFRIQFDLSLINDSDRVLQFPNTSGRFITSINSYTPDEFGNALLPVGYHVSRYIGDATLSDVDGEWLILLDNSALSNDIVITLPSAINNRAKYIFQKEDTSQYKVTVQAIVGADGQEYINKTQTQLVMNYQNTAFTLYSDNVGYIKI